MHALALLVAAAFTTSTPDPPGPRAPQNLLVGPARCVLRYLDAVRIAGPRVPFVGRDGHAPEARERDYARAKALTAPRTLEEIARRGDHPLAPWREAARDRVLESFQLVGVRRAPRGAVVVTVKERFWRPAASALDPVGSEYLVGRVGGEWRVVDRSPGSAFDDAAVAERYAGFFDDPPESK
jgi:hypothetical protein